MPSRYDVETKEIEFILRMTTNILLLFAFVLFIFSIIFPQSMLILTVIFVLAVGWLVLGTKDRIKKWKNANRSSR